ncbi:hypothetical protein DFH07DRAFT_860805 [Mycena maculata]|uniref:Uncharacterized protein n=1 Tax=Mycena maculata TaxID=230809 RepID=A0AAD7HDL7_9AGAR|nr:hypothetical protein DFH07DRAFT_860805 [Mycena maculata]
MSTNVMANFGVLDELVQVIYQGMDKFVILSSTDDDNWNIHLGLSGPEGRWWRGSWREADVLAIVGKSSSDILLESFAEKLASSIVHGELYVEMEEGERYKLTLGPTSKKPMHVALSEMSCTEAAAYATDVFTAIALQAQSRQSRLNLSAGPLGIVGAPAPLRAPPPAAGSSGLKPTTSKAKVVADIGGDKKPTSKTATGSSDSKAQEEIKALKAELVKQQQKKRHASPEEIAPKTAAAVVPRPLKGASLANPNKKARKYQAIEFESDEE